MEKNEIRTIGSFVAEDYRTANVFQKYGIDFCCKGGLSIDEVCARKGISKNELITELQNVVQISGAVADEFDRLPIDKLIDYIEMNHHTYVSKQIPVLNQFLEKLCKVHGERHPELFEIAKEFSLSAGELTMHMKKEELILFPYIKHLVKVKNNQAELRVAGFGLVLNPVTMMEQEHDIEGERFRAISKLSNNYAVPADGCTTYRVAFELLRDFEADLHKHIHLENNILFPKAIQMEKELEGLK